MKQKKPSSLTRILGYAGGHKNLTILGCVLSALSAVLGLAPYESMFQGLVRKYNKHHKPDEALPNITPHTMRHTFCTRLAHAGMNPKDLQYIMGHSNITMTLNYYAHADYTSAKAAMDRLAA